MNVIEIAVVRAGWIPLHAVPVARISQNFRRRFFLNKKSRNVRIKVVSRQFSHDDYLERALATDTSRHRTL